MHKRWRGNEWKAHNASVQPFCFLADFVPSPQEGIGRSILGKKICHFEMALNAYGSTSLLFLLYLTSD